MNLLFKLPITLFVFSSLLLSCDKEKEKIPSYLHISKFTFTTNKTTQGLNTSDIVSAKVFVNGSEIGNFALPVTFPVLTSGKAIIEIFPNIKENASSNSQKYYKTYKSHPDTVFLEEGKIDTIKPKTTYRDNTTFKWMEDFEDLSSSLIKSGDNSSNDTIIVIPTSTPGVNQPFSGSSYCAFINSTIDSFVVFERSNPTAFTDIPFLGTDVYIEMDIKTNINFQIGVYTFYNGDLVQSPVLVVTNTGDKWKKIYVNLKPQIGDLISGTSVKLFFGFFKDAGVTEDVKIYLDNIKFLYVN